MNIDFALVLVLLCAAGIVIWLFDLVFLAKGRQQRHAALKARYPAYATAGSDDEKAYQQALPDVLREPVIIETAKSFLPVLLIVLVLRSFLVEPFQIPSSSMEPTLEIGDYILVNKFTYGVRLPVLGTKVIEMGEPARGDVMVFFPPNDHRYFIKRVIGLPGDTIEYRNKVLYINGRQATQTLQMALRTEILATEQLGDVSHTIRKYPARLADNFAVTVPEGHYFMMGDNRDNSSDSRVWGFVPESNIVGRAFAVWMHWERLFSIPSFDRVGMIR
ncbi:MAG: signal peptidase I [Gammaproteobacteria bacterium]|nr:MAG: signal peptidase I [Gammaproteobacteria bacterium]